MSYDRFDILEWFPMVNAPEGIFPKRKASIFRDDNLSATISAGRKVKGTVTFEVPVDATVVEVEYLTSFWTSNRVVFDATVS